MENFTADGIYIDASPERVFTALTDPQDALVWLDAAEVRIAPAENGEYSVLVLFDFVYRYVRRVLLYRPRPPPRAGSILKPG